MRRTASPKRRSSRGSTPATPTPRTARRTAPPTPERAHEDEEDRREGPHELPGAQEDAGAPRGGRAQGGRSYARPRAPRRSPDDARPADRARVALSCGGDRDDRAADPAARRGDGRAAA